MSQLELDADSHTYTLDGKRLPSVTQILGTLGSYEGIPAHILQRAADRGDAVHYATELFDYGTLDPASLPEEIFEYVAAYMRFVNETGFIPGFIEQQVYSKDFGYAGTLDRTGAFTKLRGVKQYVMLDIKCTAKIMPTVGPQTAAYQHAWNENGIGHKTARRFVLQLKPDGTYRLEECTDRSDLSVFLSALTIYNWKQRIAA